MAQLYVSGPALCFVGPMNAPIASCTFLGTTAGDVDIETRPVYENVPNSLGGTVPFDRALQGEEAIFTLDLTRWNQGLVNSISDWANAGTALGGGVVAVPGFMLPGEIGTLVMTEGQAICVAVVSPYSAKAVYATMDPGYRFPVCSCEGVTRGKMGTKELHARLSIHAQRFFDIGPTNAFGAGAFTCYDKKVTPIPAIN
ncbi:MAG: hypothetical protein KGL39_29710 [Patescibacteria group bacterium]|nr:hypothetical protein [Patescibacteria group bacterium]